MNHELPDVQAGFRKGRGSRDQMANNHWVIKKVRVPEKHLLLLYWLHQSFWLCEFQQTGKFLEMGIPDHLTYLLRNLYAGQKATVRTGHGTADWLQIRKGVHQAVYCHPAYLTLYSEFSSVQFSHPVVSDSLRPHESQHARPLYPSPTPRVHSNSRPSSRWCHPAISSSVVPFSSFLQSLPASGFLPVSRLFTSVLELKLWHQSF